jgi:hypothetical protein
MIQEKQKELRELLVKKPLLFKKRLRELVAQVKKMLR